MELKHLAAYLPYNVKVTSNIDKGFYLTTSIFDTSIYQYRSWEKLKLLLHPLSDLTKEIEVNGEKFVPIDKLTEGCHEHNAKEKLIYDIIHFPELLPYFKVQLLLKWHFDVFDLIEKGEAIDRNTLNL